MAATHYVGLLPVPLRHEMEGASEPVLLLTGATGLVGSALLKLLDASRKRQFLLLTRKPYRAQELHCIRRAELFVGDITRPRLGLEKWAYIDLTRRVTEIIHCAADTQFAAPLECARTVNVAGTREILQLAARCQRLRKFGYISTVYVVGRSAGCFSEGPVRHGDGFFNSYQQSKYEAEELVMSAMGDIPAAIFRLSSLIGDSCTGAVRQFNHVHRLIRLFPQNTLPMVPGDPNATVDLIATDWAVAALGYLFEWAFEPGRFYHICAGPEHSFTVRELIGMTMCALENHPTGRKWLPIRVPELVPLECYEEFVKQRRQDGDRIFNELVRVLGYFLPHLGTVQVFDNRRATVTLASSGLQFPRMRDCYKKVIKYCLDTNWGRTERVSA